MFHLGTIRGTTISIDFSFLFLATLFVITSYNPSRGMHYALLWIPVLFLSILVHELAHAAMFGVFGYGPSAIVLGGIGGHTVSSTRQQTKPAHDMVISLAGPLSSFALAFAMALLFRNVEFARRDPMMAAFIPLMVFANYFWGIFNCIPISPLDGGHALRSLLRLFLPDRKAFPIAVWIGITVGAA
ncbi:MAG TPA: site-2 protease family protein, partial [Thermoanaerobaculia bacterium]|nr:site-2 protease family protein [Thermoanaerobaculia bacterium]